MEDIVGYRGQGAGLRLRRNWTITKCEPSPKRGRRKLFLKGEWHDTLKLRMRLEWVE